MKRVLFLCVVLAAMIPICSAQENEPPAVDETKIIETKSGLKYTVLVKGEDSALPTLTDKVNVHYQASLEDGTVFMSGLQAVARLAVDQLRLDRRLGLTTAAFASGYQGSAPWGEVSASSATPSQSSSTSSSSPRFSGRSPSPVPRRPPSPSSAPPKRSLSRVSSAGARCNSMRSSTPARRQKSLAIAVHSSLTSQHTKRPSDGIAWAIANAL